MARRQYEALVTMRWRMVANNVRSVHGAFEFGARGIAFLIYSIMGLALGFGLGAGAWSMVSTAESAVPSSVILGGVSDLAGASDCAGFVPGAVRSERPVALSGELRLVLSAEPGFRASGCADDSGGHLLPWES